MKALYLLVLAGLLASCSAKKKADLIVSNAVVYTVDGRFSTAEAFAVVEGKIVAVGSSKQIADKYETDSLVDAGGKAVFPGFIDGHAHFYGYGQSLQTVNLVGTQSWAEILDSVNDFAKARPRGWIIGRGWDQNDWQVKNYPDNSDLDRLFPDRPVLLTRIDGHAAIANSAALKLAGVRAGQTLTGGDIEVKDGRLTGILIDNAVDLVSSKIPAETLEEANKALLDAQRNCLAVGLTTVVDCGLDHEAIPVIDNLQKKNELKMRLYVMLSDKPKNYDYLFSKGPFKTDRLNVRAFKVYADGALGSRGACLLHPYADRPGHMGFLLSDKQHFERIAKSIFEKGFQMCTHAIGDSANRQILNTYAKVLRGKNDKRWRIEHAQVVAPADFALFGGYSVIPSVQSTHATSDMYWAADRLGPIRVKGAYAYKQLMEQNGWLVLGTDFPVENIDPMLTFYAAVVRKDAKGYPAQGFQMENALSREDALRGMTIWAAKGNFEEKEKGSIEPGKFADFVIMDTDILKAPEASLLKARVMKTYINGQKVYENTRK